jgi:hypothetical protein
MTSPELERLIGNQDEQTETVAWQPQPETLEMAEVSLANWAEGLLNVGLDLIPPGAGEGVVWTADHGCVSTDDRGW